MNPVMDTSGRQGPQFGVFISHITEEAHIARRLKEHIERALPNSSAFASVEDIHLGEDWRASLKRALDGSQVLVVLCSQRSLRRPWINFEGGGGWAHGVSVVPVCHSDLSKADLPDPFKNFQSLDLVDGGDCRKLFEHLGRVLRLKPVEDYPYDLMAKGLFELPGRGVEVGLVLTHGQKKWENAYTVFNLRQSLPEGLSGQWSFTDITKTEDLLSADLHAFSGLIVGSPWRRRMEPEVVAALTDFVKQGGRMLLLGYELGDRHHDANFNDLAAQFGLYFEADIVGPPGQGTVKPYNVPVDFKVEDGDRHELTAGLTSVRLANVQTLRVLPLGAEWLRVGRNVACRPSRETVEYREGVFSEPGEKRVEPNAQSGWLPVAAEAPRGLCGKGAVQAIGTWELLGRHKPFRSPDNLMLLGRLLDWLVRREAGDSFKVEFNGT